MTIHEGTPAATGRETFRLQGQQAGLLLVEQLSHRLSPMDLRTRAAQVILAVVEELAGRLLQALDLRHGRQVRPLTAFTGVLHVALLVALGDAAKPCLEQIPRPQLQKHAGELCVHPANWMPWNYRDTLAKQTAPSHQS